MILMTPTALNKNDDDNNDKDNNDDNDNVTFNPAFYS